MGTAEVEACLSNPAAQRQAAAPTQNQAKAALLFLHGAGVRVMEALRLRAKDVDFAGREIVVPEGNGGNGRARPARLG